MKQESSSIIIASQSSFAPVGVSVKRLMAGKVLESIVLPVQYGRVANMMMDAVVSLTTSLMTFVLLIKQEGR